MDAELRRPCSGRPTTRARPTSDSPRASVIIPAYESLRETIANTLRGLRAQEFAGVRDRRRDPPRRHDRGPRGGRVPRGHSAPGAAPGSPTRRETGASSWRAASCWCSLIPIMSRIPTGSTGGCESTTPGIRSWPERSRTPGRNGFDRGVHLTKFSPWIAGAAPGPRADLATANLLWSRSAWERLGRFRPVRRGDTELCWRARERGVELRFEPAAVVDHEHEVDFRGFLR